MGILDKTDERLSMMGDMMRATDTDLSQPGILNSPSNYAAMVSRCLNCPAPDACKTWLKQGNTRVAAPDFCPNAEVLNAGS